MDKEQQNEYWTPRLMKDSSEVDGHAEAVMDYVLSWCLRWSETKFKDKRSRGQVFDLFPKDKNRETEVSQRGFRFFLHTKKNRQLFGRIKRIAYFCSRNISNNCNYDCYPITSGTIP
jgi:hypothetical protein